jgi:hypothetical protein
VDEEERRDLYRFCLLSPLAKMIRSLDASHPYASVLRAIEMALKAEFPDVEAAPLPADQMGQSGMLNCGSFTPFGCHCSGQTATAGELAKVTNEV